MLDNKEFNRTKTYDNFATEKIDVLQNKLLGDYNKSNKYIISQEIIQELILMSKTKLSKFNNSVLCFAETKNNGQILFEIKYYKDAQTAKGVASLYVLENVSKVNSYFSNTIKTEIAKFTENLTEEFVSMSYALFNVIDNDDTEDDEGKVLKDSDIFLKNIEIRKSFLETVNKLAEKDYEKAYEEFFNKKTTVLKTATNLYSKTILENFNHEFEKVKPHFLTSKKVSYKAINELLDKTIETMEGTNPAFVLGEQEYKTKINDYVNSFSNSIDKHETLAFIKAKKAKEFVEVSELRDKNIVENENLQVKEIKGSEVKEYFKNVKDKTVLQPTAKQSDSASKYSLYDVLKELEEERKPTYSFNEVMLKNEASSILENKIQGVKDEKNQQPQKPVKPQKPEQTKAQQNKTEVVKDEINLEDMLKGAAESSTDLDKRINATTFDPTQILDDLEKEPTSAPNNPTKQPIHEKVRVDDGLSNML